ncbi:MAG TPA: SDR family NAD(P)-dependent oxidoreductase [Hyphomonadaceae bacterium]|nr:SDR family NAD(P)-dependent oxidoreductase [Hyphomonadaceae bacterium]
MTDWFSTVGYQEAPLVVRADAARQKIWLIVAEKSSDARQLAQALAPDRVVIATPGKVFAERLDGTFHMNFANPEDYAAITQFMEETTGLPDHVVYLTSQTGSVATSDEAIRQRFAPLVHLFQSLGAFSSPMQVSVATTGISGVAGAALQPMNALALGPILVAPREFGHIQTRCIDLLVGKRQERAQLAALLASELRAETGDKVVALGTNGRWVRNASSLSLPHQDTSPAAWAREDGVYLVTGGLAGIGLEVASHLARNKRVRLALLAREPMPAEDKWDSILEKSPSSRVAGRIAKVRELRALGSHVMVVAGDVADQNALSVVVAQVRSAFGPINGVIHAAGVMDDGPMMLKSQEAMRRVLAPKVAGTLALDATVSEELDFFVLFSSVASSLGLPGQADYTAANAFQDVFARARSARAHGRTLVVNWNAWRDVGMAVSAHRREVNGVEPIHFSRHPALDGYVNEGAERTFVATFNGSSAWLLDEHQTNAGASVLPGTGFVELARAAYAEDRPGKAIELNELEFITPFRREAGQSARLEITLKPAGDANIFTMRAGGQNGQDIVTGRAREYAAARPERVDIDAISARCGLQEETTRDRKLAQSFMAFGPRWANIERTRYGANEALVELRLDPAFAGDLADYILHPAMLDMATGGAQALIPGVDLSCDFFVPLGYASVRVFGAMPGHVFSHVRCSAEAGSSLAYFDVTLCDEDGNVFADISRFTMRRIEENAAFASSPRVAPSLRSDTLNEALLDGIRSFEGLEALDRLMAQPNLVQAIASSVDVNAWNARLDATQAQTVVHDDARVEGFDRLPGLPEYVAPSTGAERVLASIWADLLGFKTIGVADNFFDLGGNSLLGVRLFAAIRKKFSVSLPLATLFEAQTIAELAKLVADPGLDVPATTTGWSPIVCLRPGIAGQTPVFCIHGSRGNVLVFKPFADRVRPEQPVYALQAAGVDGKMEPDQTIEVMARRYLAAIRQVQPTGPYMFAGYSGGGVIGYEMARMLREEGLETSMLMLIDTLEPEQMRHRITLLDRLFNFHRVKLFRFAQLPYVLWKSRVRPLVRKLLGVKDLPHMRTPLEEASEEVDRAYKKAQQAYQTPPADIDVVLIRAMDARIEFRRSGPTLGWSRFVRGNIRTFDVDAEHHLIFMEPSLSQLIGAFNDVVEYKAPANDIAETAKVA